MLSNDLALLVPQTVIVVFPATGSGAPANHFYTVTVTLASLALPEFARITGSPHTEVLHRYEVATYPGPSNSATLLTLAKQAATDWYLWQVGRLDQQFTGIVDWTPEGYHDIEWRQGGGGIATRVIRGPLNDMADLIYRAVGIHQTEPPPCNPSTFFDYYDDCVPSPTYPTINTLQRFIRAVTVGCGDTVYGSGVFNKDFGIPCASGPEGGSGGGPPPCQGIVGINREHEQVCVAGTLYDLAYDMTLRYNDAGCLEMVKGPTTITVLACDVDCCGSGTGPPPSGGSGSGPPCPEPCEYCTPFSTPATWTVTLAGFSCGAPACVSCDGGSAPAYWEVDTSGFSCDKYNRVWNVPLAPGESCTWYTTVVDPETGDDMQAVVFIQDLGATVSVIFNIDNDVLWSAVTVADTIDCCSPIELTGGDSADCGQGPVTVTLVPFDCGSGCDFNGDYTLTRYKSCHWQAVGDCATIDFYFFKAVDSGAIIVYATITDNTTNQQYAQYASEPFSDPVECCQKISLRVVQSICADVPEVITFEPTGCPCGSGSGSGSGGGVTFECCPDDVLPFFLYLTVIGSDTPGAPQCSCMDGTYELAWDGLGAWTGRFEPLCPIPPGNVPQYVNFSLTCLFLPQQWVLTMIFGQGVGTSGVYNDTCPLTCNPVTGSFEFVQPAPLCNGTVSVELSE